MKSGIYCIFNNVNLKRYVGFSKDLKSRKNAHYSQLRKNKHNNHHLQAAYNIYKEESFTWEILEYCNIEVLPVREKYWISFYNSYISGYNKDEGGSGDLYRSENTRKSLSKNNACIWKGVPSDKSPAAKKCYQYDLKGNFIKEWSCIKYAAEQLNINANLIGSNINGKIKRYKDNMWFSEYKGDKISPYKRIMRKLKDRKPRTSMIVYQYTIFGLFVKKWDSIKDAAAFYNTSTSNIHSCVRGVSHQAVSFHWKNTYAGECIEKINIRKNSKLFTMKLEDN